jgi:hypothetical protein
MNPLSCAEVEEEIDLYALLECDPATGEAVAAHLAGCRSCARAYQESRRMLGLLDLHFGQERGLARLKARVAAEDRPLLRIRPPAVRRMLALAALLLLTLGLTWLAEPGPPGAPPSGGGALVARLIPRGAVVQAPGGMEIVPGAMKTGPEPRGTGDGGALMARLATADFQKVLEEGKHTGHPPLPPAVSLDLRLENKGSGDMVLLLEEGKFLLHIELKGPGVVRLPVPRDGLGPFAAPSKIDLPAGETRDLRVVRLSEVLAGKVQYVYWTEPGRYTLSVRLEVRVEGRAAPLTATTRPIPVRVKEAP